MMQFLKCLKPTLCSVLASGATIALALVAPPPALAAISAGPPIQVPWLIGINFFGAASSLAVLDDGSFAIAAVDFFLVSEQDFSAELLVQFFRSNGAAQTRPTALIRPPAVVDSAGIGSVGDRYLLVSKNDKRAYALFYSKQGTSLDTPIRWPYSDIPFFITYYRFGAAPLWRFLPITYRVTGHDQEGHPFYSSFVQVADADGLRLGAPVELPVLDAAINGSGQFVVVESACSGCNTQGIQIFDSAVKPLTPFLTAGVPQLYEPGGVQNSLPLVAINTQGQILLAWVAHVEEPTARRLVARLFDETGSPVSDVLQLTPPANALSLEAEPIALDDGSFLFAFITQSLTSLSAKVFIERFDPRTQSVDEPIVLAAGHLGGAMLAVNGSGKGVYVWQTLAPSEAVDDAYMRTVRMTP